MPNQVLFTGALSWLLTYAVHSSVLLGAVWLLLRWRGPRSLALQERLWKLALVGPLLTASLQLALGARPWLGRLEWSTRAPAAEEALAVRPSSEAPLSAAPGSASAALPSPTPELAASETGIETDTSTDTSTDTEPTRAERPARQSPPSRRAREPRPERLDAPAQGPAEPGFAPAASTTNRTEAPVTRAPSTPELENSPTRRLATPPSWPGLVLVLWAGLGLLGVLAVAGSFVLLWRRLSGREMLREGPLVATLDELRRRAGLRRHVRLSISSRVSAPFSTGILLPEICLPRAVMAGLTPAQQEVLLAHELGHLMRRDPFWFAAGAVLEKLFFFQPLNRVARHELAELAELACDDCAVRWTGSRLALASCLTEVAGWLIEEPRRPLALPGLTAPRSPLGRRVARLLDDRRSPSAEPRSRSWPVLALGTLGLTVVAVPGISAASPAPARDKVDVGPPVVKEAPAAAATLATPAHELPARVADLQPAPEALALGELRLALEQELAHLQGELAALRAELEQRDLDARFAAELAAIEARLAALDAQRARAAALLDGLVSSLPSTPAPIAR